MPSPQAPAQHNRELQRLLCHQRWVRQHHAALLSRAGSAGLQIDNSARCHSPEGAETITSGPNIIGADRKSRVLLRACVAKQCEEPCCHSRCFRANLLGRTGTNRGQQRGQDLAPAWPTFHPFLMSDGCNDFKLAAATRACGMVATARQLRSPATCWTTRQGSKAVTRPSPSPARDRMPMCGELDQPRAAIGKRRAKSNPCSFPPPAGAK
jgi:hypothetical protein